MWTSLQSLKGRNAIYMRARAGEWQNRWLCIVFTRRRSISSICIERILQFDHSWSLNNKGILFATASINGTAIASIWKKWRYGIHTNPLNLKRKKVIAYFPYIETLILYYIYTPTPHKTFGSIYSLLDDPYIHLCSNAANQFVIHRHSSRIHIYIYTIQARVSPQTAIQPTPSVGCIYRRKAVAAIHRAAVAAAYCMQKRNRGIDAAFQRVIERESRKRNINFVRTNCKWLAREWACVRDK